MERQMDGWKDEWMVPLIIIIDVYYSPPMFLSVIKRRHHKAYLFYQNGSVWNENRQRCQKLHGDLVSMETEGEWEFIKDEIQNLTNRFGNEWHIGKKSINTIN